MTLFSDVIQVNNVNSLLAKNIYDSDFTEEGKEKRHVEHVGVSARLIL